MVHDKTFLRENGDTIKITVFVFVSRERADNVRYGIIAHVQKKDLKDWLFIINDEHKVHYTDQEILQAKLELWEKLKPL